MKRLVLFILFLVVVGYFVSQNYALKTGTNKTGKYSVVLVDKKTQKIFQLMGGEQ